MKIYFDVFRSGIIFLTPTLGCTVAVMLTSCADDSLCRFLKEEHCEAEDVQVKCPKLCTSKCEENIEAHSNSNGM